MAENETFQKKKWHVERDALTTSQHGGGDAHQFEKAFDIGHIKKRFNNSITLYLDDSRCQQKSPDTLQKNSGTCSWS